MTTSMATKTSNTSVSIADSSALVSIFVPTDAYHAQALALARKAEDEGTTVITPEVVVVETVNIIGKKFGHQAAVAAAGLLAKSGLFLIVESSELLTDALAKFGQADEKVSLTDCVVMATADKYGTRQILGFDDDFRDFGYLAPIPRHKG
jgi:uncharacterized protein